MHWLTHARPCLALAALLAASHLSAAPFAYVGSSESTTLQRIDVETGAITSTYPLTAPAYGIATDAALRKVYVTHPSANALTIIDIPSGAITYFTIGANPRGVVVDTLTSRVYVANAESNNVVSFLPSNPDARQTIGLPAGFGGGAMALSRGGERMVVVSDIASSFGDSRVVVIDSPAQVTARATSLASPCGTRINGGVALSPDGSVAYAFTDRRSFCVLGISSPATASMLANLPVGEEVLLRDGNAYSSRIFTNGSGSRVYAALYPGWDTARPFPVADFESAIAVIDAGANIIGGYIRMPCGPMPTLVYGAALTPDETHVLSLCGRNGAAPLVDLARTQLERTLTIAPPSPTSTTDQLTSVGNFVANF